MYDFEFQALVRRTAEKIKKSPGLSGDFLRITRQEARSTGVTHRPDLDRITKRLREKLAEHSASARSARAKKKVLQDKRAGS